MEAITRAISIMGGPGQAAKKLSVVQSAVSNWIARGRVPAERCISIEEATNGVVTRYELRPDIFGPAPAKEGEAA